MRRAIVVLVFLAACGKPAPKHPNVLLITIDTLRADAVGPDTPALSAFFRQATRFRGARTVAPLTLVAHASLFTGLLPAQHGIHDNATEPLPPRARRGFPLLAEQFRDAGYRTAAFAASAVVAEPTGVGSGFELYDCPESEGEWEEQGGYIPAEERIRAPLAWMEGAGGGRPWFAWVQLFDPHAPYHSFGGDARRAATRDTDPVDALYRGEVRRADAAFEKLLAAAGPETVVVVCSDHGESLGEHGEPAHGVLCYGATLDVLLALRAPGFRGGAEDSGPRSLTDVAPTLRRLCGLPAVEGFGRDLAGPPHETLVAESLLAFGVHGWAQVFAATDGRFTLVEAGTSLELFDRSSDPGETAPLDLEEPAFEKLDRALDRFHATTPGALAGQGGEMLLTVSAYGGMRRDQTGYLPRHENATLMDPRGHMGEWAALESIPPLLRLCVARRDPVPLDRALRVLDEIGRRIPQSPRVDHYRASVLAALADLTGVPARYSAAARSELAAIKKGYVHRHTIQPAIAYAVAASDADAMRTLIDLLRGAGVRLDAEMRSALEGAAMKLDVTCQLSSSR